MRELFYSHKQLICISRSGVDQSALRTFGAETSRSNLLASTREAHTHSPALSLSLSLDTHDSTELIGTMSREELALETQLLLQEVSQVTQYHQTDAILDEATATAAPVSQYEEAKQALLEKLKKKKEQKRQQMQQVNQKRYGIAPPGAVNTSISTDAADQQPRAGGTKVSPVKQRSMMKLPIAANTGVASRKKKDLLTKLRTQAIQQGSQEMAKLFGYSSYEEQIKHLNKIEKQKILQNELMEQQSKAEGEKELVVSDDLTILDDDEEQQGEEAEGEEARDTQDTNAEADAQIATETESELKTMVNTDRSMSVEIIDNSMEVDADSTESTDVEATSQSVEATTETASAPVSKTGAPKPVVKRRNQIDDDDEEDDGNEADSEQDDKDADGDDNDDMDEDDANVSASAPKKDKAAGYRRLLQAEALQNRHRRRLKQTGDFVEAEAEEDEEEDVLKIGGLGDFGFGVPQAKTQESKEAEEERNALKLREDDLEGIVDELSDDEREQAQDLEEIFRKELEDQDRQQVKEVMRNVKEGFGRNRRAFSAGLHMGSEARGRFNLDELVAADGKVEAARLGLLESDEELSDADDASGRKKKKGGEDDEEGEGNEEDDDEEAEMERMLRERYLNQPKIYMTSSESEEEEECDALNGNGPGADENEVESDEERERQQMKLFSERARINRRMQRMKDVQRQVALDEAEGDSSQKSAAAVPNLLLEEDEDSQELMKLLNRTDVAKSTSKASDVRKNAAAGPMRPRLGRFNSFGVAASSRSTSSFSRVAGNVKMFNTNSAASSSSAKGFVFTSFSSEKLDQGDENMVPNDNEEPLSQSSSSHAALAKSKSWSASSSAKAKRSAPSSSHGAKGAAANKKQRKSDFFSVLSSYQVN
ncbi:hypothetical protein FI667_g11534, partial [Globisporangium splendens]